ncbi:MAG: hypothetical protein H6838_19075 [Planctomycetes bacterium]|nr:hypothetical protein [Planctomycetota bacterium]MCB9887602.1 hypothetical protein [Planctomycetota bacterium]
MFRRAVLMVAVVLLAVGSCQTLPLVDNNLLRAAADLGVPPEQVRRGYDLMLGECTACHAPVHPLGLSREQWREVLPRMVDKSGLTAREQGDLEAYLRAVWASS